MYFGVWCSFAGSSKITILGVSLAGGPFAKSRQVAWPHVTQWSNVKPTNPYQ